MKGCLGNRESLDDLVDHLLVCILKMLPRRLNCCKILIFCLIYLWDDEELKIIIQINKNRVTCTGDIVDMKGCLLKRESLDDSVESH